MVQEENPEEHHIKWVMQLKAIIYLHSLASVKCDEHQLRAVPDMPYHIDKHLMCML